MRIPLARYGTKELLLYGGGAFALAALFGWLFHPVFAIPLGILGLIVVYFFRDPKRVPPTDPTAVVSPADGKVTHVDTVDHVDFLGDNPQRVGIFLSVFDVHLNRAPLDGEVVWTNYQPGRYLNVLNPESLKVNESNWIGIRNPAGVSCLVRQVSGAIARRIVCPLAPRAQLTRGQEIGMIKLGSRTEFYIEAGADFVPAVKVGDKVRAGKTIIGHLQKPASSTPPAGTAIPSEVTG